jgi:riboflavin synthase
LPWKAIYAIPTIKRQIASVWRKAMFTGLIGEVGSVSELSSGRRRSRMIVAAPHTSRALKVGDSIAVSGVCLTAVQVDRGKSFSADLAQETLARTSFSRIRKGARVNLELPLQSGARLGGHSVQGHVDGVGQLISLHSIPEAADYWLTIALPKALLRYVVEKGSITIEGISLTVARIQNNKVTIAIIPHTYKVTNLRWLQPGAALNIEVDVLAKYAAKMTAARESSAITMRRLIAEGF